MGPAAGAAIPADEPSRTDLSAQPLKDLPSPVELHASSLEHLSLSRTLSEGASSPLWTPRPVMPATSDARAADINNPFPLTPGSANQSTTTDMNLVVGGALAPVPSAPPTTATPLRPSKFGPNLRLPSFESLGIASPHPDRYDDLTLNGHLADKRLSAMAQALRIARPESAPVGDLNHSESTGGKSELESGNGGRAVQTPVHHYISTLTPPAENGHGQWPSFRTVSNGLMDSPNTDPGAAFSPVIEPNASPGPTGVDDTPLEGGIGGAQNGEKWIDGAVQSALANLTSSSMTDNPVRVLSHALPSPSSTGHIYSNMIEAMHEVTPSTPTQWINVFHAITGRFNLADLPTSPPATPGPAIGGDDYFTQKVFDSAVSISDYQLDLSALPRSPRPVVPPSSINLSVVERYIPPTSVNEFADMFNTNGPSILVDRLVELSPKNGSLVFIYPTRTGAQTFMKQYLSPVLDPILRSMVVVNGLSSELGRSLGNMCTADSLPEHDDMHRQILTLCDSLTERSNSMQRFHGHRAHFELTHVDKKEVMLEREVWARDWWTKQEKPRVKDVVTKYALEAQRNSSFNEYGERATAPAELIQELLEGVVKKPYVEGCEPERGVEVSVFVIKRSG